MTTSKKTVIVTGCSKDSLGEALAKEFHRRNYHVIATARSLSRLESLASMGIDTRELDLLSSSSIKSFCAGITSLDILFNNAGGNLVMPFADTSPQEFRHMFDLNFFPVIELTQFLLPHIIRSKGIIVNHTSQSAYGLKVPATAYACAKAALACLTDCMRIELAPFDVRVVEVVTGMASSNITKFEATPRLPQGSIYSPVRERFEKSMKGADADGYQMSAEKWAKRVVSDLLDRWFGTPKWIWRGAFATTMYVIYWADILWKGCMDGPFRAAIGIGGLKKLLAEEKKTA
ncbi:NADPH-dependent 1-acyl dihydroxyacetone phosphate reductase [Cladophialophora chaetospira]|uniref:NADPH-dependent 1-acyl dihydroxyacetone phosphate reductase n=1 Tax=Cladophialophora chaetospira TaxID=386627 RepID=A0AA38WY60_9EURO|nr:NADPH-dependent 1-acyl dihydroxyacetone phosphate reductase [Cladophialophora chaetospira]